MPDFGITQVFLAAGCILSAMICGLLIRFRHHHGQWSLDGKTDEPQKLHVEEVPRIGGLAVWLAAGIALLGLDFWGEIERGSGLILLLVITPVFLAGLLEDLTRRVGINTRFLAAFVTAILGAQFLDASITRLAVPGLDEALQIHWVSVVMTCVAVGGVSHAFNIVDGSHGLTAGIAVIAYTGLAIVAASLNDQTVVLMSGAVAAALIGFLVWNFPAGKIFLGDGGAYATGACFAILAAMLVARHPDVSPWFLLLVVAFPVWETVFSMGRRVLVERKSSGEPDARHLHSLLILLRIRRPFRGGSLLHESDAAMANATLLLWLLSAILTAIAVKYWDNVAITCAAAWLFAGVYCVIYPFLLRRAEKPSQAS